MQAIYLGHTTTKGDGEANRDGEKSKQGTISQPGPLGTRGDVTHQFIPTLARDLVFCAPVLVIHWLRAMGAVNARRLGSLCCGQSCPRSPQTDL